MMLSAKAVHFLSKMALHRPLDIFPAIIRRSREAISKPPTGIATTYFKDVRFDVDTSLHAITGKYYFQTHEMFLDAIFRKFLRPGQIFIDVGANMGYWSAKAASLIASSGEVHAFEPVPRFFRSVEALAKNNPRYSIQANNLACGSEVGSIQMAVVTPGKENYNNFDTNIGSSSALPGFLDHAKHLVHTENVGVVRLDDYIEQRSIDLSKVGLIKIDVEGFESFVLDGMPNVLASKTKVPILCEVLTDTTRHKLLDATAVIKRLSNAGYRVLDATTLRPIDLNTIKHEENILCI